jgi:predicted O-linked N-acetylglucosamine transferase (SPINDLY family)
VAPPPCLAAGFITFASLCSQYKINDEVIEAWAMILRQAPEARLLIKNAALGDSTNRAALHERFGRWEIPPTRVLLEGPAKHEAFLAAYERVDIALDTFPYNGGTTTMEALWQGVPVLTFNGDRWASRQSRSLLLAAGLDDWVMPDRDAYIARAVTLARSPLLNWPRCAPPCGNASPARRFVTVRGFAARSKASTARWRSARYRTRDHHALNP